VKIRRASLLLVAVLCFPIVFWQIRLEAQQTPFVTARRVLLISIDGLHGLDLANFVRSHPNSTLAQLSSSGVTYTQAFSSKPSNSFVGLLALVTGGSPSSTGFWFEGAYARTLSPPGSNCKTVGTEVGWGNTLDWNRKLLDGGGGIDPAKLPLDPSKGCVPVYPHNFLRVNTMFEVIHFAGMRTAWIDKHPSYEMTQGPSGMGVDDFYGPEIASVPKELKSIEAYDDGNVEGVLNQVAGRDHTGKNSVGVPTVFGMAFQSIRFAQVIQTGGYTDGSGTPSASLLDAIEHTDQSIGKMVGGLKARGLLDSTLIIVSAKHGESPIDPSKYRMIDDTIIPEMINRLHNGLLAFSYVDGSIASIWLNDQSQTAKVAATLSEPANQSAAGIEKVLWGESLKLLVNDPTQDNRIPDIVILPKLGGFYDRAGGKFIAMHGGFSEDDTHVALLVSNPNLKPRLVKTPVQTAQVAPTILQVLGIAPETLQAVTKEGTAVLPDLFAGNKNLLRLLSPE
jgi:hypothetical protein